MLVHDCHGAQQLTFADAGMPDTGMPGNRSAGPRASHRRPPTVTELAEMCAVVQGGVHQSLATTPFVVVDLETTGGSADRDAITEIGAVKICGGEVVGEFATLVDPGCPIPPEIVTLTGITTAMVSAAPRIGEVLASFLEFARGAVLVAHNSRFDLGFLAAAARRNESRVCWTTPGMAAIATGSDSPSRTKTGSTSSRGCSRVSATSERSRPAPS